MQILGTNMTSSSSVRIFLEFLKLMSVQFVCWRGRCTTLNRLYRYELHWPQVGRRLSPAFGLKFGIPFKRDLLEHIYILLDGFTYNTRGYFASCGVFFRDPKGRGKIRAMSKMSARIICKNHRI